MSADDRSGPRQIWFPARRQSARHFASEASFLAERTGTSGSLWDIASTFGRPVAEPPRPPRSPRGSGRGAAQEHEDRIQKHRRAVSVLRVPWFTFVLGSGCLSAADAGPEAGSDPDFPTRLRAALATSLVDFTDTFSTSNLDGRTADFITLLMRDRTGRDDPTAASAAVDLNLDFGEEGYPATVALAAMLATHLHANARQGAMRILRDEDPNGVAYPRPDTEFADWVVEPLKTVLDALVREGDGRSTKSSRKALAALCASILQSMAMGRVRALHVELITAFAWHFLTEGTKVYPGWNELLLFGAMEADDGGHPIGEWYRNEVVNARDSKLRPPVIRVDAANQWIRERIVAVSNHSWESRQVDREPSERARFYNSIAGILHEQASATTPSEVMTPVPVGVVTSFDLELEMALWQQKTPYVVVMPIFAIEEREQSASLHWVWTEVDPHAADTTSSEGGLQLPRGLVAPGGWKLLKDGKVLKTTLSRKRSRPVVVRLTGSPLMDVPELASLSFTEETKALHHALLLDEYTSLQLSAQDLSGAADGLPTFLTGEVPNSPSRFWLFFGAQLADPGVRLRLISQHLAARMTRHQDASMEELDHDDPDRADTMPSGRISGLLINERSHLSDRELFLWHDFDVIDGRHVDWIDRLDKVRERLHLEFEQLRTPMAPAEGDDRGAA